MSESANALFPTYQPQSIPFATEVGGERFEIVHHLDGYSDESLLAYYETEDSEDDAVSSSAVELWNKLIIGAAGYDGELPLDQLRELVPDADKAFVIENGLLRAELMPAPLVVGRKLKLSNVPPARKHRLKCWSGSRFVITEHKLADINTDGLRFWRKLQARQFPFQHGDLRVSSFSRGLCALYEMLVAEATNYQDGKVPPHHKMIVIAAHLREGQESLAGK